MGRVARRAWGGRVGVVANLVWVGNVRVRTVGGHRGVAEIRLPVGAEWEAAWQRIVRQEVGSTHRRAQGILPVRTVVAHCVARAQGRVVAYQRVGRCERIQGLQHISASHTSICEVRCDLKAQAGRVSLLRLGHPEQRDGKREREQIGNQLASGPCRRRRAAPS